MSMYLYIDMYIQCGYLLYIRVLCCTMCMYIVCTYSSAYCILYTQNENVNRAHTSACKVRDLRRPDRRTAMKALVQKTFKFVDVLWEMYISRNRESLK